MDDGDADDSPYPVCGAPHDYMVEHEMATKDQLVTEQQFRELKGRYDELEKRYQELQAQQKRLTDILDRMSQQQGR